MEMKRVAGREGAQPDSGVYLASVRPLQRPLSSHPFRGSLVRALWSVEALRRGTSPVFRAPPPTASRTRLFRSSLILGLDPHQHMAGSIPARRTTSASARARLGLQNQSQQV